jgi:hypothetical protein
MGISLHIESNWSSTESDFGYFLMYIKRCHFTIRGFKYIDNLVELHLSVLRWYILCHWEWETELICEWQIESIVGHIDELLHLVVCVLWVRYKYVDFNREVSQESKDQEDCKQGSERRFEVLLAFVGQLHGFAE